MRNGRRGVVAVGIVASLSIGYVGCDRDGPSNGDGNGQPGSNGAGAPASAVGSQPTFTG